MDYDKLPKHYHEKVIQWVDERNLQMLLYIHNKFKLTQWNYDCCGQEYLLEHYKEGIRIGAIKGN